jgi:methionyl-tRNA formyltransferase
MRVVFMGTPSFAVPSLRALAAAHEVVAVYTRPDAASGRGRTLKTSPVADAARDIGIPLRRPQTLRDPAEADVLRGLSPDIACVAAYGLILPTAILTVPRLGCLNVHASLLPRWRGAAPVQRAILAGDAHTGVTIMRMQEGLDTGPWCVRRPVAVGDRTTASLTAALAEAGAHALLDALALVEAGTAEWTAQDEALVTYAAKVTKDDVALMPDLTAECALRRVRASSAQAPARACVAGTDVTVTDFAPAAGRIPAGTIHVHKRALLLGFSDGSMEIRSLTPHGKAQMQGAAFARGARLATGETWGACGGR